MKLRDLLLTTISERAIEGPETVWEVNEDVREYHKEVFVVLMVNSSQKIIKREIVSIGTAYTVNVHPREIFREAIIANSRAIILAHNHPGGDTKPSQNDLQTTRKLVEAGDLLGIKVLDHVIITKDSYNSILECEA